MKLQLVAPRLLPPEVDIVGDQHHVPPEAKSVAVHDELVPDTEAEMLDGTQEVLHCYPLMLQLRPRMGARYQSRQAAPQAHSDRNPHRSRKQSRP